MALHPVVARVTETIRERSRARREAYSSIQAAAGRIGARREATGCTNLAHAIAAFEPSDKLVLKAAKAPNLAIVTAYNDMLSAHQPYAGYPNLLKQAARDVGCVAQVAGGVPAMCDGVTQGDTGMELSLFSRDVIAMSTAVALSHNVFDAALCLGVCDKIVPGLLIGALQFGHLPTVFVPAGPMTTGLANDEKAKIRQLHAQGKVRREALLEAEMQAYHGSGTCTFYGTANSNQMLMEIMGLHLPGAAFINPGTALRDALSKGAAQQAAALARAASDASQHATLARPRLFQMIDERSFVNAIIGLLATGGSTNHTIHLVAMAAAAGIALNWDDFDALSTVVPLLARVYPNGAADVNHFHAAGGMGFLIRELIDGGLLHDDVGTVMGVGLHHYTREPWLDDGKLAWRDAPRDSLDENVLRPLSRPFAKDGGLRLLRGNLGRSVIKVSAVKPEHQIVEAPAIVFDSQEQVLAAYKRGELQRDFIAVVRFQGPRANGMPELHKLTPPLGVLQDAGFKVALVTDGRMSGASGKVPAAIHLTPECLAGGALGRVRTGDLLRLDAVSGQLEVLVASDEFDQRALAQADLSSNQTGMGRELFAGARSHATGAEQGAVSWGGALS